MTGLHAWIMRYVERPIDPFNNVRSLCWALSERRQGNLLGAQEHTFGQPAGSIMHRVLVVEDEFLIRLVIIDALEEAGFEVIEAATADDAVGIIDKHEIHLLFTDVQMPGKLSGVDLAHVIAKRFPGAGIIVASGRLTADDIDLPPSAVFLSKPYSSSTVIGRLRAMAQD